MAQVSIMLDDDVKDEAETLFEELGMTITTAFNIFVRQAIRQGGMPFEITTKIDPFYSENNLKVLRQSIKDADEGKLTEHDLIEE